MFTFYFLSCTLCHLSYFKKLFRLSICICTTCHFASTTKIQQNLCYRTAVNMNFSMFKIKLLVCQSQYCSQTHDIQIYKCIYYGLKRFKVQRCFCTTCCRTISHERTRTRILRQKQKAFYLVNTDYSFSPLHSSFLTALIEIYQQHSCTKSIE